MKSGLINLPILKCSLSLMKIVYVELYKTLKIKNCIIVLFILDLYTIF